MPPRTNRGAPRRRGARSSGSGSAVRSRPRGFPARAGTGRRRQSQRRRGPGAIRGRRPGGGALCCVPASPRSARWSHRGGSRPAREAARRRPPTRGDRRMRGRRVRHQPHPVRADAERARNQRFQRMIRGDDAVGCAGAVADRTAQRLVADPLRRSPPVGAVDAAKLLQPWDSARAAPWHGACAGGPGRTRACSRRGRTRRRSGRPLPSQPRRTPADSRTPGTPSTDRGWSVPLRPAPGNVRYGTKWHARRSCDQAAFVVGGRVNSSTRALAPAGAEPGRRSSVRDRRHPCNGVMARVRTATRRPSAS